MTALQVAQFVALVGAGLFFLIKLGQGWFMVNMSLSGSTDRRVGEDGTDDLAVSLTVTKGNYGSAQIHDTVVRVEWDGGSSFAELIGTERLSVSQRRPYKVNRSFQQSQIRHYYRLPPGEATTWSCRVQVPTGQTCIVEAVVIGRQWPNRRSAQWRCSLVSMAPD